MEGLEGTKALFIVVNAGHTDTIMDIVRSAGASGATVINARGEGAQHELFCGITVDSEKELIMTVVSADTARQIMAAVKEKAGLKSELHGICFVIPVDQIIGINTTIIKEMKM